MLGRMMVLMSLGMLLAVSPPRQALAQPPKPSPPKISLQDLRDFGVTGIRVLCVKALDTGKLNAEIQEAAVKGEAWTKEAVPVALRFAGAGLKGHTTTIEVRTPPEERRTATITITAAGYLDDAVGGERWRLWLAQGSDGVWTIKRALWAQLCQRAGRRFYSAEPCP